MIYNIVCVCMYVHGMQEEISARRKQVNSANDKFGKIYKKINEDSDEQIVDSEVMNIAWWFRNTSLRL